MSDTGHTPLPWNYFVGNANGRGLIRVEASHDSPEAGSHIASMPRGAAREANAAYIVTACNALPLLVEALEPFADVVRRAEEANAHFGGVHVNDVPDCREYGALGITWGHLRRARAALASIKGGDNV